MTLSDAMIQAVWEKGRGVTDRNQNEWRKDQCGAWLQREQYNNTNSEYGWIILNVVPGGEEVPENLQPLHCNNGFDIANGKPKCHIIADRAGLTPVQHIDQPHNTTA
jgi:hypothetical protein